MQILFEILKITFFAAIPLYGVYMVVKSFLNRDMNVRLLEAKSANAAVVTPIRLQAYERVALLLERTNPNELIRRLNDSSLTCVQLQQLLLNEIRNEYQYNLSQQVYLSNESWELVKNAIEETISLINSSAEETERDSPAINLSRKIFEKGMGNEADPHQVALSIIKEEIQQVF